MDDLMYFMDEDAVDKLTGMSPDMGIIEKLAQACETEQGALMIINLDNSEIFNDVYGYDVGEVLIEKVEEAIRANTADDSIHGRIGGDEFVVFCRTINDKVAASRIYGNINNQISEVVKKLVGEEMRISLGASFGVVFVPEQGTNYDTLFNKAYRALDHVKQTGNTGCAFYEKRITNDDTIVMDDFDYLSKGLDGGDKDKGALWLEYDYFSIVYRFMRRYIHTYKGSAVKMLISITPTVDDITIDEFNVMTRAFGKIVNSSLRKSDLMMQSRKNQFFLLLPEIPQDYVTKVFNRIRSTWAKTEYYDITEISYEADRLTAEE